MAKLLPIFLAALFSLSFIAMEAKSALPPEEYRYQQALYFFRIGDYLSSSKLSSELLNNSLKEKDKALLLLRFSDIKLLYTMRNYPSFDPQTPSTERLRLLELLDILYNMGDYEESLLVSKELGKWGTAQYFGGISLLNLNYLENSRLVLLQIPEEDRFYPYSRVILAQIEVMKHNFKKAEEYLREILSRPSIQDGLSERVHILLGQVLFESDIFAEALQEFLQVSFESPFYREAVMGQVWSLIKLGRYESAIPIIETIKPSPPYDIIEQEAEIILGYCYLKLGRFEQAVDHFQTLLSVFSTTEEGLEQIIKDRSLRERYLSSLLSNEATSLTDEEQHYLLFLRGDPSLSSLIEQHRFFEIIRSGFIKKEKEILEKEIYIENAISGIEKMLARRDNEIKRIRDLLLYTNKRMKQYMERPSGNITFFTGIEEGIYELWRQTLKRDVAEETKMLIRFILQEWTDEGIRECVSSIIVCHIVNFLSIKGSKEGPEQLREIVWFMEMFGRDLSNMEKNGDIEFEREFLVISEKGKERIKNGREALKKLEKMKKNLMIDIMESEKGSKESLERLDTYIMERFIKLKYELGDLKADIKAGLDAAVNGMEQEARYNKQDARD